jgi:hypothetical protein
MRTVKRTLECMKSWTQLGGVLLETSKASKFPVGSTSTSWWSIQAEGGSVNVHLTLTNQGNITRQNKQGKQIISLAIWLPLRQRLLENMLMNVDEEREDVNADQRYEPIFSVGKIWWKL